MLVIVVTNLLIIDFSLMNHRVNIEMASFTKNLGANIEWASITKNLRVNIERTSLLRIIEYIYI